MDELRKFCHLHGGKGEHYGLCPTCAREISIAGLNQEWKSPKEIMEGRIARLTAENKAWRSGRLSLVPVEMGDSGGRYTGYWFKFGSCYYDTLEEVDISLLNICDEDD